MKNCRVCNHALYGAAEQTEGICQLCKKSSGALACMKCKKRLITKEEIAHTLCVDCKMKNKTCVKCSAELFLPEEKDRGICARCAR